METPITMSVLIPYHNSQETLAETIRSVMRQDVEGLEIIVADDHSDTSARLALDAMARSNGLFKIVDVHGRGPSAARNAAVAAATGDVYCFLDADDCLRPGALDAFKRFLEANPDVGVTFGRVRITEDPASPGGIITPFCADPTLAQIIGENRVCTTSNVVVRAKAFSDIGFFNEKLFHAEDQEWLARAHQDKRWGLAGLNRVTLDYRTSPGGLSSNLKKMESGWRQMVDAVMYRSNPPSSAEIAEATGLFYRYLARRALRLGHSRTDSAMYMARSLTAYPRILLREAKRTWPTLVAASAVLCLGVSPFKKVFR